MSGPMREATRAEVLEDLNQLRDAAWWYREMVRAGGPDSSDLDLAVSQDLDAALELWQPRPMLPELGGRLLTYQERRDVSARIPWLGREMAAVDHDPLPPANPALIGPSYQARRVGGCLMTLATVLVLVAASRSGPHAIPAAPIGPLPERFAIPSGNLETLSGAPTRDGVTAARPLAPAPRTEAPVPSPTGEIGTALVGGWATWYRDANEPADGLYAAVSWWLPGPPYQIRVCSGDSRCVVVTATGWCACGDRHGIPTIADLSPAAFRELAALADGIVQVSVEWPVDALPATDVR